MKTPMRFVTGAALACYAMLFSAVAVAQAPNTNLVIEWNQAALQGVRDSKLGPPMVSRALAIVHTCIYDAWSAYDERAVGTQLGGALRRPSTEWVSGNVNQAVSFAAYRAAVDLLPGDRAGVFDPLMANLGYDAHDQTRDAPTPAEAGTTAWAPVPA